MRISFIDLAGSAALLFHDGKQEHGGRASMQYPFHASRARAANSGVFTAASAIQLPNRKLRAAHGTPGSRTYDHTRGKRPFMATHQRERGASV